MKKRVLLIIVAALCLLASCEEKKPSEYEKGIEKLEKREYEQAIEHFEDAIQKGDQSLLSWKGIGIARIGQGDYKQAEEAFSTAFDITKKDEKALQRDLLLYLADAQYHQENFRKCIDTCNQLLKMERNEDAYFLRGNAYLEENEVIKAEEDFQRVILRTPNYQDYLDIYMAYQKCSLSADGAEYLEQALKLKGNSAEDYYQKGRVYFYLSEYKKAEKALKTALEKKYQKAALYLGKVYAKEEQYEEAISMYKSCLESEDMVAEAYNGLACCAAAEEDYERALSYVEKGLEVKNPEMKQVLLFNQIVFFEKSKDFSSAREKLKEYLNLYPQDKNAVRESYFLQTR